MDPEIAGKVDERFGKDRRYLDWVDQVADYMAGRDWSFRTSEAGMAWDASAVGCDVNLRLECGWNSANLSDFGVNQIVLAAHDIGRQVQCELGAGYNRLMTDVLLRKFR